MSTQDESRARDQGRRRVVTFCSVSIDGFSSGPGGPELDTWLHEHAVAPGSPEFFEGVWRRATTVVMGRVNADGFGAVWPSLAENPQIGALSRAYGRFLVDVEKVAFSRTLPPDGLDHHDWRNIRVASDLEGEVRSLREKDGGDILVQNSASIIRQLLRADLVDDLRLTVVPVLLGDGLRLLDDLSGIAETRWHLAESTALDHGAVTLHYSRSR